MLRVWGFGLQNYQRILHQFSHNQTPLGAVQETKSLDFGFRAREYRPRKPRDPGVLIIITLAPNSVNLTYIGLLGSQGQGVWVLIALPTSKLCPAVWGFEYYWSLAHFSLHKSSCRCRCPTKTKSTLSTCTNHPGQ